MLEQNPGIVPPSLDLAAALTPLSPLLERLQRLTARVDARRRTVGDVMDVALAA